ncbi:MAG: hypothetical protein Q8Q59_13565 [Luteolibacter sp.]|nr:hypothetical protein [Luteolibacter sp.]
MAKRVSMKHKRMEAPEWVFSWRQPGGSWFPKMIAILVTSGVFAVLLSFVRIQVAAPVPWAAPKAAVIQVLDDAEGRTLTLRAREGGPFPSRFDPSGWEWAVATEREAHEKARWRPEPYVPILRKLPDVDAAATPPLAARGVPVLPIRRPAKDAAPANRAKSVLAPALYPLSGMPVEWLPEKLPAFDQVVDSMMAAEPWRFLLRLDTAGRVLDCVSLSGGDEAGRSALDDWLRHVSFQPDSAKPPAWIAVGVGFSNQAADESDAR